MPLSYGRGQSQDFNIIFVTLILVITKGVCDPHAHTCNHIHEGEFVFLPLYRMILER